MKKLLENSTILQRVILALLVSGVIIVGIYDLVSLLRWNPKPSNQYINYVVNRAFNFSSIVNR